MAGYIQDVERLERSAHGIELPPEEQIEAALQVLSHSPVNEYPVFTIEEVILIGQYRLAFSARDRVWNNIWTGKGSAWPMAIHEAVELNAFVRRGANPFDPLLYQTRLGEAHAEAILVEVQFLKTWATRLGMPLSEAALELTNPYRSIFTSRFHLMAQLRQRYGWAEPNEDELARAAQFWRRIVPEEFA